MPGPPSLLAGSARRRPPPRVCPFPSGQGVPPPLQALVEPSGSQARSPPLGSPRRPTPCHLQNLGFNVYFLIRMPAMRTEKGRIHSLPPSPSLARRGPQGRRRPPSGHHGSDLAYTWRFLFISFTCSPPARTPARPAGSPLTQEVESIFIFRVRLFLPEKGKSWKRF